MFSLLPDCRSLSRHPVSIGIPRRPQRSSDFFFHLLDISSKKVDWPRGGRAKNDCLLLLQGTNRVIKLYGVV